MNARSRIALIIQREYLTRVRKKSFIVMTLLAPFLFSLLFIIPVVLAFVSLDEQHIWVKDDSGLFVNQLKEGRLQKYHYKTGELEALKKQLEDDDKATCLVWIPAAMSVEKPEGVKLFSRKNPGLELTSDIEEDIEEVIKVKKMTAYGLDPAVVGKLESKVTLDTKLLSDEGEKDSSAWAAYAFSLAGGFLIYIFVFSYGSQVLRGVIEEKTNRIVEVIVSSVKPTELLMGKVVGIALVGLTQFLLWVVFTGILAGIGLVVVQAFFSGSMPDAEVAQAVTSPGMAGGMAGPAVKTPEASLIPGEVSKALGSINMPLLLTCFLFYFMAGYILYASLFAAIGSAVDSETDSQQFMAPVTIPIVIAMICSQFVIRSPDGWLAIFLSMFPMTSPVIMMVRIPFGVPIWQVLLSMAFLVAGFLGAVWFAARIYRVGILMYGKKPTWKELFRWLRYTT